MNRKIILWLAALIITFLTAFLHQRSSPFYPVSGSIGIEGNRVTYVFQKVHYGREPAKILIRNDLPELQGTLLWRSQDHKEWIREKLVNSGKYLTVSLKLSGETGNIEYYAELIYNSQKFRIPKNTNVNLTIKGKRPASVMNVFYFFLFGGLLLAVRGALEYFNPRSRRMLFPVITAVFFFIASVIFYPFIKSYELNAINRTVPDITALFDLPLILVFLTWFVCSLLVFKYRNMKVVLAAGAATVIIYQFSGFY